MEIVRLRAWVSDRDEGNRGLVASWSINASSNDAVYRERPEREKEHDA